MEKSLNETPAQRLLDTNRSVKSAKSTRARIHPRKNTRTMTAAPPTCAALLQAFAAARESGSERGMEGGREGGKRGETTQLTEEEGEKHPDQTQRSLHVRDGR